MSDPGSTMGDVETVRYTYRLRPGAKAEAHLMAEWHRCRWLWNEAVRQFKMGRGASLTRLSKLLTEARAGSAWLSAGARVPQDQTLRIFVQALHASYSGGLGRPKYKTRKRSLVSLQYSGTRTFTVRDSRLVVARGVGIPIVMSRPLPSKSNTVNIYRDSLGHWYASFVVRRAVEQVAQADGAIGIDWGVRAVATTTDAVYDLPHPGHRRRCAAALAKEQRKMARRHRPGVAASRGYLDAKKRAAKLHKKAQRQNAHTARGWAQAVVRDHHLIAVEDFKPKFLARSTMARKAADGAIGAAKRELIYRAQRAGREVVLVPPAYTTMTCSECATRTKQRLELSQRTFRCENCGYIADRDRNAARTILATAKCNRASADDVRHQAPPLMLSELGISA